MRWDWRLTFEIAAGILIAGLAIGLVSRGRR